MSRLGFLKQLMRPATTANLCQMGAGSSLGDEGIVENILGDPRAVKLGNHSVCRGRLLTYGHGGNISIGDWCYIGVRSEVWSMVSVTIGDRVLISHDVNIHDGTAHSLDPAERHAHFKKLLTEGHPDEWQDLPGVHAAPIVVEDDVWISFGVTILRGVTIGARSVISAGSMVTRDVPPDSLYRNSIEPVIQPLSEITQRCT